MKTFRKRVQTVVVFLVVLFALACQIPFTATAESKSITLAAIADGHVRGGVSANLNFGRNSNMGVRNRAIVDTNHYESYVKFSIPAYVGTVKSATLRLTYQTVPTNAVGRSYTLSTTATDWTEGTGNVNGVENDVQPNKLTYNTAPAVVPPANSTTFAIVDTLPVRGDSVDVEVGGIINTYLEEYSVNGSATEISIRIVSNAAANETDLLFRTKENLNGGAPVLTLDYISNGQEPKPVEIYTGLSYMEEPIVNSAGKNVNMYLLEVDADGPMEIVTGVPNDTVPLQPGLRQTPTEQAKAAAANGHTVLAAVNADFFRINDDAEIQPRGLTVKDGKLLTPMNDWKFFGVLYDGTPVIGDAARYNQVKDQLKEAVGGDSGYLIKDGVVITEDSQGGSHAEDTANPRTAVGIKADGTVVFVVADGRTTESEGLVLTDLANYMLEQGVVDAINLDGGGSSAMSVKDPDTAAFVTKNKPSDGSERAVGNTLLVIDPRADEEEVSVLSARIQTAKDTLEGATFGIRNGDYAPEQETLLTVAIHAAEEVLGKSPTKPEVTAAVSDLQAALEAFVDTLVVVDYEELTGLIAQCRPLYENAVEGDGDGQYTIGSKAEFQAAIQVAQNVAENVRAAQAEVDAAGEALRVAMDSFADKKVGVSRDSLNVGIAGAEKRLEAIEIGGKPGQYPQKAVNELRAAIDKARMVVGKNGVSQAELDKAGNELQDALEFFEMQKISADGSGGDSAPAPSPAPATGDGGDPLLYVSVVALAIAGVVLTRTVRRKYRT